MKKSFKRILSFITSLSVIAGLLAVSSIAAYAVSESTVSGQDVQAGKPFTITDASYSSIGGGITVSATVNSVGTYSGKAIAIFQLMKKNGSFGIPVNILATTLNTTYPSQEVTAKFYSFSGSDYYATIFVWDKLDSDLNSTGINLAEAQTVNQGETDATVAAAYIVDKWRSSGDYVAKIRIPGQDIKEYIVDGVNSLSDIVKEDVAIVKIKPNGRIELIPEYEDDQLKLEIATGWVYARTSTTIMISTVDPALATVADITEYTKAVDLVVYEDGDVKSHTNLTPGKKVKVIIHNGIFVRVASIEDN